MITTAIFLVSYLIDEENEAWNVGIFRPNDTAKLNEVSVEIHES